MKRAMLAVTAAVSLAWSRMFGGAMDGMAYDVKIKADSFFSFAHQDTLIFRDGRLTMAGFIASGFEPASYTTQTLDDAEVWNASLTHPEKGVLSVQGLTRGDEIDGVAVLWTRDGKLKKFTFHGSRKTADI
jgi:hypothetical protein